MHTVKNIRNFSLYFPRSVVWHRYLYHEYWTSQCDTKEFRLWKLGDILETF